ncbi:MAG: glycerol-3-phosphate dehydrogenase [Sphingobacteriaceae bacterium]|nr:glycerol-3-phosphate dehydrogenase [Sphingobacteriaceae bacterium]
MEAKTKVAVLGGGSWATAIVKMLSDNKVDVAWWMRDMESVAFINKFHHNPRYIPSAQLKLKRGAASNDLGKVIQGAHFVVMAVPAAFLKEALQSVTSQQLEGKVIVSAIKGMIPDENLLIANFFFKYFNVLEQNFLVISGPCHAEEVAQEKLSYLTIAGVDTHHAQKFAALLRNDRYMSTSVTDDIYGTEYSAVMKNIYAIAGGIAHGLGYGDNYMAVLVSNAIIELKLFLREVYPVRRDIKGSAYLGDLLVTAYSQFSRNRTFGNMVGKGYSVKSAQFEMNMVAEGYYAVRSVHNLNKKLKCDLPIAETVYRILYEGASARQEFKQLSEKLR